MLIPALALLSLAAPSPQAQPAPQVETHRVSNLSYGSYDFDTGFQRTPAGPRTPGPDVLFSTIWCSAYYYAAINFPTIQQEWVDEIGLPTRGVGGQEQINGFSWAYCAITSVGYYDAVLSIYEDTTPGVGPSVWTPLLPSFANCLYLISGLPDFGCWSVSVDLSGGAECTVPQTGAPGAAYIGWSFTPMTIFRGGPILLIQSCAGYGTVDSYEWRDWSGLGAGTPYTHVGTFNFGGTPRKRADFPCEVQGAPEDIIACYGNAPLDVLILQSMSNAEPGASFNLQVENAPAGSHAYALLISRGGCASAPANSNFGTWTRQFGLPTVLTRTFSKSGPIFPYTLQIPAGAPANSRAVAQVVQLNGAAAAANVQRASNGLAFYL